MQPEQHNMPQTETVTSYYDAVLKAPLIISQTAVVGVVFSRIFFQRIIRNKIRPNRIGGSTEIIDYVNSYLRPLKRLFIIILSSGIAMLLSATSLFLLQALSLSSELGIGIMVALSPVMFWATAGVAIPRTYVHCILGPL